MEYGVEAHTGREPRVSITTAVELEVMAVEAVELVRLRRLMVTEMTCTD